jgi:hypothetical protein
MIVDNPKPHQASSRIRLGISKVMAAVQPTVVVGFQYIAKYLVSPVFVTISVSILQSPGNPGIWRSLESGKLSLAGMAFKNIDARFQVTVRDAPLRTIITFSIFNINSFHLA